MAEKTTDEVLLQRAGGGDQTAFRELYERHRVPIFRFAYRLLGSVETAEDVTHDCFLGLIRKTENFHAGRASLRTYLFGAARNLALKHFRGADREARLDEMVEEPQFSPKQEPLRRLLDEELATKVREAVLSLSPLQREALVLFEYEGLALIEIASLTGTDVGVVKGRLYRARERLRSRLLPYLSSNLELNSGQEIVTLKEA